jgi:hypothetical protein
MFHAGGDSHMSRHFYNLKYVYSFLNGLSIVFCLCMNSNIEYKDKTKL